MQNNIQSQKNYKTFLNTSELKLFMAMIFSWFVIYKIIEDFSPFSSISILSIILSKVFSLKESFPEVLGLYFQFGLQVQFLEFEAHEVQVLKK